jgi:hypothetical protein
MEVLPHDVGETTLPFKVTALLPRLTPKLTPVKVTDVPTAPELADSDVRTGFVITV